MKRIPGFLLGAILLAGCDSGGGGAPPAVQAPVAPLVLNAISVAPAQVALSCGQFVTLTCMGTWSNGSIGPEAAIWTSSSATVEISSGSAQAATTRVCWKSEGSAVVHYTCGEFSGDVAVATGPEGEWTLYGIDYYGWPGDGTPGYSALYAYPVGGGAPVKKVEYAPGEGAIGGVTVDASGSTIYYQIGGPAGCELHQVSTVTWEDKLVVTHAGFSGGFGLDHDSEGFLWATNGMTGGLVRIDPVTGAKQSFGATPGMRIDVAVSPDDGKFLTPLGFNEPQFIIKHLDGGGDVYWGSDALLAPDADWIGWTTGAGIAFNAAGDCFACGSGSNKVWRYRDANLNGDALDDGECTPFGELYPDGAQVDGAFGVAVAPDGTVLVNVMAAAWLPWQTGIHYEGIWAFKDLNHDGDAMDPGEKVLFSSKSLCPAGNSGLICVGRGW